MLIHGHLAPTTSNPRRGPSRLLTLILAGVVAGLTLSETGAASEPDAAPDPHVVDTLVAECLSNSAGTADAAEGWVEHCRQEAIEESRFRSCMATVPRTADAAERWVPWCREVVHEGTGLTP